ncbi:MAG: carbohydrate-binding domain-containing protein [Lachnospiraceae bacterium]|nr:carbohydrate-binding domain-containing protein [Lachnospiraceae bacterium]
MEAGSGSASASDADKKLLDCRHICDKECGYQEAAACRYRCYICPIQKPGSVPSAPEAGNPGMEDATPSNAGNAALEHAGKSQTAARFKAAASRTETLTLGESSESNPSEGWAWVADADAKQGTLTLTDCHITADKKLLIVPPQWETTLVLKGENVLESTNTTYYGPLITNASSLDTDVHWIIEGEGSLALSAESASAFGFSGQTITMRSGTLTSFVSLCIILNDFIMEDGSLTITATSASDNNGIYSNGGPVKILGGNVDIQASQIGIWLPGVGAGGTQEVCISGGDVTIDADYSCIFVQKGNGSKQSITIDGGRLNGHSSASSGLYATYINIKEGKEAPSIEITAQKQPAIRALADLSFEGGAIVNATSPESFGLHAAGTITVSDSAQVTAVGKIDGTAENVTVEDTAVLNAMMRKDSADGRIWTVYGNATLHNDLTLGPEALEMADQTKRPVKLVITPGANLTIPDGVTLDATENITLDTLDTYLSADEATLKRLKEEQGILKLPLQIRQIRLNALPAEGGTVEGGGEIADMETVTVTATAADGYHFVKWLEAGAEAGTTPVLSFTVTADRTLTAVFEKDPDPIPPDEGGDTPGGSGDTPGGSGNTPGGPGDTPGGSGNTPGGSGNTPGSGSGNTPGSSGSDSYNDSGNVQASDPSGSWVKDEKGWRLRYSGQTYASGRDIKDTDGAIKEQIAWIYKDHTWWAFGADGYLKEGWVFDSGSGQWYYINTDTGMKTGWHRDLPDGPWYYLDPENGHMVTGWRLIAEDWYYMNPYGADKMPLGAMYQNERTPDGHMTAADGKRIE